MGLAGARPLTGAVRAATVHRPAGELAQSHHLNYHLIRLDPPVPGIHLGLRQVADGYTKEY